MSHRRDTRRSGGPIRYRFVGGWVWMTAALAAGYLSIGLLNASDPSGEGAASVIALLR